MGAQAIWAQGREIPCGLAGILAPAICGLGIAEETVVRPVTGWGCWPLQVLLLWTHAAQASSQSWRTLIWSGRPLATLPCCEAARLPSRHTWTPELSCTWAPL